MIAAARALMARLIGRRSPPDMPQPVAQAQVQAQVQALASEQAINRERQRIYQGLHDDLGAKLLDLVYGAQTPEQADRAREALQILRDVVSQSSRPAGLLADVLDTVQAEAAQRLAALDIALDWQQPDVLPMLTLDQARVLHLARIVREAISNALRHARTRGLRVRIGLLGPELLLDVTDLGRWNPDRIGTGQGTVGMREHADGLDGEIRWDEGTQGGTKVLLRFPLPVDQPLP